MAIKCILVAALILLSVQSSTGTGDLFFAIPDPIQFDGQLNQILSTFSTTISKQLSLVNNFTDTLINTAVEAVEGILGGTGILDKIAGKAASAVAPPFSFNCDPAFFKSDKPPTSAHAVRIGDIKMIAAMGDSITAGIGTISNTFISAATLEGRGYCSKGGGTGSVKDGNTTIATIMRDLFGNTDLKGYAVADNECTDLNVGCSRLNVANKLALHPHYIVQAVELVRRIIFDPAYNPLDWKMVHLFYGINDLCLLCQSIHYSTDIMAGLDLRIAITILKAFLKNVIIYLHVPYDLTYLPAFALKTPVCLTFQTVLCPCAANPVTGILGLSATPKSNQGKIIDIYKSLMNDPNLNNRDDFTMTMITHLTNTQPPKDAKGNVQTEILAADCVHPSRAAHYIHSKIVINEMFTAPAERPQVGDYTVNSNTPFQFKCPTAANPYLRTNKN